MSTLGLHQSQEPDGLQGVPLALVLHRWCGWLQQGQLTTVAKSCRRCSVSVGLQQDGAGVCFFLPLSQRLARRRRGMEWMEPSHPFSTPQGTKMRATDDKKIPRRSLPLTSVFQLAASFSKPANQNRRIRRREGGRERGRGRWSRSDTTNN